MGKIFKDQTNFKIIVDCKVDVSTATTLTIKLVEPDETAVNLAATLVPGSTTKIQHVATGASIVDQVGKYSVRGYADGIDGNVYGDYDYFYVHEL